MKVQIAVYNVGQPSQFFGLVRLEQNNQPTAERLNSANK